MKKLRIVFMGTPDFAVGILDSLIKENYEIVGVVTATDKPAGRGQKIKYSAVKEHALAHNLPILQPDNLKDETFLSELKALNANLQLVVAFRMLPKAVWEMPELGTFNLHASLLPDYRGAAPINWAIINGEITTGVTTFFIDDKIDTGAMIVSNSLEIKPFENAGELHDRLLKLGSETVAQTLKLIENEMIKTTIQEDSKNNKLAPKLNKENCKIDWTKSAHEIHNIIRGLSPYPSAWCLLKDSFQEYTIKIYEATFYIEEHAYKIGTLIIGKKEMKVAVRDGFIQVLSIQFPGKKKMNVVEFLNGVSFSSQAMVC
jgi:methionyl-tRNA formyltransferase